VPGDGRCAPSAVSRTATDGPLRQRVPASSEGGGGFQLVPRLGDRQLPRSLERREEFPRVQGRPAGPSARLPPLARLIGARPATVFAALAVNRAD
jgi:hypothetical protein